jgi:hypothetical protein
MAKKSEWVTPRVEPKCPNNDRHGEMNWHPKGGMVCEKCQDEHTGRSRVSYRFGNPSGLVLDKSE